MSMDRVSMALDDVVKADRKANKGNKNGKKGGGPGANKKNGAQRGAVKQPATAQLVKKLVKRALAQRGVGARPRNIVRNNRNTNGGTRTIVKKIVRRVPNTPRGRNNRNSLGISQRSRTIVRRSAPQPQRTIVREVRYVRDAPRVQQRRVVYQQPPRQVVYVQPRSRPQGFSRSSFSSRRPGSAPRRNLDPFYEPRNYLQRVPY